MHWVQVILKQVMGISKDALQMLNPDSPFEPMGKINFCFSFL